jgi:hypothetical protein
MGHRCHLPGFDEGAEDKTVVTRCSEPGETSCDRLGCGRPQLTSDRARLHPQHILRARVLFLRRGVQARGRGHSTFIPRSYRLRPYVRDEQRCSPQAPPSPRMASPHDRNRESRREACRCSGSETFSAASEQPCPDRNRSTRSAHSRFYCRGRCRCEANGFVWNASPRTETKRANLRQFEPTCRNSRLTFRIPQQSVFVASDDLSEFLHRVFVHANQFF